MPASTQDFVKGLDFTALVNASGAQHNQLVELGTPALDKGLNVVTTDTALNTPDVPDASVTTKWKKYLWIRIPHATATDPTPLVYAWNDNATLDATLKRWIKFAANEADFEADVNIAIAEAQAAQATANLAIATANTANATATTALSNANDAVTTANAVADDATNALAAATDAQTNAVAAQAVAADALGVANAATATATNALNEVLASRAAKYVCVVEQQNANVDGGANVAGANVRQLNTEKNDSGNLVSIAAGIVTVNAGTYRVSAWAIGQNVAAHQLYLVKNSDNSTLIIGAPIQQGGSNTNMISRLEGMITLGVVTAIRLDHYFTGTAAAGLGLATNIGPADKKEIYSLLELEKLD